MLSSHPMCLHPTNHPTMQPSPRITRDLVPSIPYPNLHGSGAGEAPSRALGSILLVLESILLVVLPWEMMGKGTCHSQGVGNFPAMVLLCPSGDEGAKEIREIPSGLCGHSEGPCDQ